MSLMDQLSSRLQWPKDHRYYLETISGVVRVSEAFEQVAKGFIYFERGHYVVREIDPITAEVHTHDPMTFDQLFEWIQQVTVITAPKKKKVVVLPITEDEVVVESEPQEEPLKVIPDETPQEETTTANHKAQYDWDILIPQIQADLEANHLTVKELSAKYGPSPIRLKTVLTQRGLLPIVTRP